jgi:DNA polymerase III delta prime subunit
MFENIIGQEQVIASLLKSFEERTLPQAILFHGPQSSGKLSTALELVRGLTCENGKGEWQCDCSACRKQRLLIHPDLLILGSREFDADIEASADVLTRTQRQGAQFMFLRSCRKLLRRFDSVIWEGEESKAKQFASQVTELEELLDSFSQAGERNKYEHSKASIRKIVDLCIKLSSGSKTENIPINQIRRAIAWAHLSTTGKVKAIIIENADKMLESSRNSLLKILEEPAQNLYIVLTTARKDALIKTILSRLRPYSFKQRSETEEKEVLKRIFQESNPEFASLRQYFLSWKDVNPLLLKTLSEKFIALVSSDSPEESDIGQEMDELFAAQSDKKMFSVFVEELFFRFSEMIGREDFTIDRVYRVVRWTEAIKKMMSAVELLNLSPKNVITALYYKMRAVE